MADSRRQWWWGSGRPASAISAVTDHRGAACSPSTCGIDAEDGVTAAASPSPPGTRWSSATSKMVSAISLGVFWRLAPSTIAIMRSRKHSPGLTVIRTTSQSDSTWVPPVTERKVAAGLADHRCRLAGDGAFVHRGHAFDHLAIQRDHVTGLHQHDVRPCAVHLPPAGARMSHGPASSASWPRSSSSSCRAATRPAPCCAPRPGFGEVGEEHGEPQPGAMARTKPCGASP